MRKIKILLDYGAYEGMKFQDEVFNTVSEAVVHALALNYGTPFMIVEILDWKAVEYIENNLTK
jgi:hypothetical protein